jgi:hypothetical protein
MPPKKTIKLTIGTHLGQRVILIGFNPSETINAQVSKFDGARWIPAQGKWVSRRRLRFSLDFSHDTQLGFVNKDFTDSYPRELQEGIKRTKFALISKLLHFISKYLNVRYLKLDINAEIC